MLSIEMISPLVTSVALLSLQKVLQVDGKLDLLLLGMPTVLSLVSFYVTVEASSVARATLRGVVGVLTALTQLIAIRIADLL